MVKDAYRFALPLLVLGLILLRVGWKWPAGVFLILGVFVCYFFRNPDRVIPAEPDAVVSPADGKVVVIVDEPMGTRPGQRISIFLSVFNVHVNRAPVAGRVTKVEYRPGKFYGAFRSRASMENAQNVIAIETPAGEMVFKQISGAIARRVISWKAAGDQVSKGELFGIIRFGSRVDVWLPADAEIVVALGDKVAGGSSILARWKSITKQTAS
ncbi:MAG: phosphatidylserine decarboxylase family protein [Candidatus Acidiferrales bacterium]